MRLALNLGLPLSLILFGCGDNIEGSEIDAGADIDAAIDAATPTCVDLPSGAIAWWDGEAAGNDILDGFESSGNTGDPTTTAGHVGDAVEFGVNQFLVVNPGPTPASFTIEAWVSFSGVVDPYRGIYSRDLEAGLSLKNERVTFSDESEGGDQIVGNTVLVADTFHHVAVTYDGTDIEVFVNGSSDGTAAAANVLLPTVGSIGGHDDGVGGDGDNFLGLIDELTIYDRVLTEAELTGIAAADTFGKCKP